MGKSKIEWTDMSWPVVTGCTPCSIGCTNCYAARMAATRLKHHPRYAGLATIENGRARWSGEVRLNYDVLEQPLRWRKPRRVFVASMGDLFHDNVPDAFISKIFRRMLVAPDHTFQVLTKRPDRMSDYIQGHITNRLFSVYGARFEWSPTNIWFGTSIENQATADERVPLLLQTPAAVHYVSVEPILSAVDLKRVEYKPGYFRNMLSYFNPLGRRLDWVVCGGESGPGARPPNPDWVRSLRDQCQAAGVPFFFKQWGEWMGMDYTGAQIAGDGAECFRWSGVPMPPFLPGESIRRNHRFNQNFGASRIGKKRAGHLLDGREHQEFPQ